MSTLLTISDVSKLLKVQPRTLRIWIKENKLAAILLPNGEYRMREEFLENWLNKKTIKAKI